MRARSLAPLLGITLLGLALSTAAALAADEAKGTFRFGKVTFQPADWIVFRLDGKDPAKPVTIVALTDFRIDRQAAIAAIDTAGALAQQAREKGNRNVVTVSVVSPDRCGVWAYLAESAQSITLSDNFPATQKTSTSSRIAGECFTAGPGKMFDDEYEFRLTYDLPVTAIPKPSRLPAGGGAPGAVVVALVDAIRTANWNVARLHLREEEVPATPPKASELKDYFRGLALNYPKTATVTGGLVKGDLAQVEIRGTDNDGKKIAGTFAMRKTGGNWRVLEWSLHFTE